MTFAKLETPNSQYLTIAQCWFNVDDYFKAKEALDKIAPGLQQHPEVLKLRGEICKGAGSLYLA